MNNQSTRTSNYPTNLHASSYESTSGLIFHSNTRHLINHVHHGPEINQASSFLACNIKNWEWPGYEAILFH